MNALKLVAILLIVGGVLGLTYGGFSYTKDTTAVKLGPLELSVQEKETVNVPMWVGIAAIAAGRMLATADFNAMQMAYLAAECAVRHLRGEVVPERIELPVQIVDARNCEQWNLPYEARPGITLEQLNDRRQAP